MKIDVRKLYNDDSLGWYDYDPMIHAFGNVAIQVDAGCYQGDTYILYDNAGKIGYLVFGWGSCSGCDALQACNSLDDVQDLCENLYNDIRWFDNKKEALEWFNAHDFEGDYAWYYDALREFISKVKKYLNDKKGETA